MTRTFQRPRTAVPQNSADPRHKEDSVNWRGSAACLTRDPELFFPLGTTGPAVLQVEEAKTVCRGCPVAVMCLTWALEAGVDHGVWGGQTEDERRATKRRQARHKVSRSA